MSAKKKIRVGILGASGYTGADLVRLLVAHPNVEIALLTAERKAGLPIAEVFPHLVGLDLPDLISINEIEWPAVELDVVFCALPHATSQEVIKGLLHATNHSLLDELIIETVGDQASAIKGDVKIVDLSADFRLRDTNTYAQWYGREHQATDIQKRAVYGLPEVYREQIKEADLVACPGCYPTAALLALVPLLKAGVISAEDIIIDAKSGVSGAGRSLKESNLFVEVAEAMHPYGVGHHRHMPEIEQELSVANGENVQISFTPHLVPMNRGELETIYVKLKGDETADSLKAALVKQYADEQFVTVLDGSTMPATRMVRGSNNCVLNVFPDRIDGRAIVVAAIDNLVKGSSGQAIQNMNLMLGLDENTGLMQAPMFP
ncbi:N-acetyl-gamma-glutamyl-phosphate reductase [Kordiimonas sp. SCSIO 12603]|uniref:N-acetyl-gamma-glutamyl-phosphate reductase n=1 Tax=Kordiimonas sp. SCSIO 12603 TaxID=2829596 RepID=UPI00210560C2|nr:N-acetyl-gamma-glutamyl-phosphate reductase [Kordiimonas sp. SCSIO 12603]UTW57386.1 N-acetyl-gamma-glutamyl-phosphate reductase [Kordiimonas sp. SCSIO 12603]